jgi:hypothetical protein
MFVSSHKLIFEVAPWKHDKHIQLYRVGTCNGQWFVSDLAYHILSVENSCPGNGHLDDVFEWFEQSCKRDRMPLMIMDFFNQRFKEHCINKRGFIPILHSDHVIKVFI